MDTIGFLDFSPSIHHTRIANFLNQSYQIESYFITHDIDKIETRNLDALLIGELDKTIHLVEDLNLPKIGISWARDIQRLLNQPKPSIIQGLLKLDLVIVDCEYHKKNLINFGISPNKILNFPFGVNLSKYNFSEKARKHTNYIVYSNRSWEPGYGYETLLEAYKEYANYSEKIEFRLAGDGSLRIKLMDKYKSLFNSGKLVILGNISEDENIEELKKSDLYISASEYDGISVSILESMAIGTPVIVSDIPPNLEIISDGKNGLIFNKQKSSDLFFKMNIILNSNQKMSEFANRSRKIIEAKANWTENMKILSDKIAYILNK
jgi:glycosyltransferase involved in cell wall biosynthesis